LILGDAFEERELALGRSNHAVSASATAAFVSCAATQNRGDDCMTGPTLMTYILWSNLVIYNHSKRGLLFVINKEEEDVVGEYGEKGETSNQNGNEKDLRQHSCPHLLCAQSGVGTNSPALIPNVRGTIRRRLPKRFRKGSRYTKNDHHSHHAIGKSMVAASSSFRSMLSLSNRNQPHDGHSSSSDSEYEFGTWRTLFIVFHLRLHSLFIFSQNCIFAAIHDWVDRSSHNTFTYITLHPSITPTHCLTPTPKKTLTILKKRRLTTTCGAAW
jgi:hypothetical protein